MVRAILVAGRIAAKFRFRGAAAHAAASPEQGRSALDAVELTCHASELLREHTPDLTRIHHVITGGEVRERSSGVRRSLFLRPPSAVRGGQECSTLGCSNAPEAGDLATETKLEVDYLGGTNELVPNDTLSHISLANLRELNDLKFSPEEERFATRIFGTLEKPLPLDSLRNVNDGKGVQNKGSTDVGDVSWVVPTTGFSTICWVPGTPGHSWQATAAGGTTIGRKGMLLAAKVLAATAYDLYTRPEVIAAAKEEHAGRVGKSGYRSLLVTGQKPPLDYRRAPAAQPNAE